MSKQYIHPVSLARIDAALSSFPQSTIISGPVGIGLSGIAQYIADKLHSKLQIVLPEKDEKVDIEKGVISVDSIRRLYETTKTVETGKRIIAIDYTERMGAQAQNAFLKLLEEPGLNTYFILLSHQPDALLPTIQSRTQQYDVQPITNQQSNELLDTLQVTDPTKRSQLLFIAKGLPAQLTKLANDEAAFTARAQIVRDARQFLQGSAYDRLVIAQTYKDSREKALILLEDALKQVESNVVQGKVELLPAIDLLLSAYERIKANGNVRLQLAAAMV